MKCIPVILMYNMKKYIKGKVILPKTEATAIKITYWKHVIVLFLLQHLLILRIYKYIQIIRNLE